MKTNTRIKCHVKSCEYQDKNGICNRTAIHLHPCSTEADNIVGCSEFYDMINPKTNKKKTIRTR